MLLCSEQRAALDLGCGTSEATGSSLPRCLAAKYGLTEIAELLLDFGADVNAMTYWDGRTPLHRPALEGPHPPPSQSPTREKLPQSNRKRVVEHYSLNRP